jgi:hypothetical protein
MTTRSEASAGVSCTSHASTNPALSRTSTSMPMHAHSRLQDRACAAASPHRSRTPHRLIIRACRWSCARRITSSPACRRAASSHRPPALTPPCQPIKPGPGHAGLARSTAAGTARQRRVQWLKWETQRLALLLSSPAEAGLPWERWSTHVVTRLHARCSVECFETGHCISDHWHKAITDTMITGVEWPVAQRRREKKTDIEKGENRLFPPCQVAPYPP